MEIRIEERMTGRELRDRILGRHGSRRELVRRARRSRQASADLFDLRLLEEDPRRLDMDMRVTTVATLTAADLERLTPARIRLLARLSEGRREMNVSELARALRRDKKNVSEDLSVLARLGLVEKARRGRETIPSAAGREIHISLGPAAEA